VRFLGLAVGHIRLGSLSAWYGSRFIGPQARRVERRNGDDRALQAVYQLLGDEPVDDNGPACSTPWMPAVSHRQGPSAAPWAMITGRNSDVPRRMVERPPNGHIGWCPLGQSPFPI